LLFQVAAVESRSILLGVLLFHANVAADRQYSTIFAGRTAIGLAVSSRFWAGSLAICLRGASV
jgi:hypothetical protein